MEWQPKKRTFHRENFFCFFLDFSWDCKPNPHDLYLFIFYLIFIFLQKTKRHNFVESKERKTNLNLRQTCFSEACVVSLAVGSSERSACFSALFGASLHFEQCFIRGGFVVSTLLLSQLLQLWPAYIFQKLGQCFVGRTKVGIFDGFMLIITQHQNKSTILSIQPVQPLQRLASYSDFWLAQTFAKLGIILKCSFFFPEHSNTRATCSPSACAQLQPGQTGSFIIVLRLTTHPGEV